MVIPLLMLVEQKRIIKEFFQKRQVRSLVLSQLMKLKNQQKNKDLHFIKLFEKRNLLSSKNNRMAITNMSSQQRTFIQRNSMSFSLERHSNAILLSRIVRLRPIHLPIISLNNIRTEERNRNRNLNSLKQSYLRTIILWWWMSLNIKQIFTNSNKRRLSLIRRNKVLTMELMQDQNQVLRQSSNNNTWNSRWRWRKVRRNWKSFNSHLNESQRWCKEET